MAETLPVGTVLSRYRIEAVVGVGGMGTVYRATQLDTGASVAVKALHPHIATKHEWQRRFLREARAAMAASHPNVVKILEVFEHDGAPLLAMELLEGESLEKLLVREHKLPLDRVCRIMVRVTSAVGTAHAMGIIHRDLKPDNIFLSSGDEGRVKVLDFGIAKLTATEGTAVETVALTKTGALIGTPFFMSPEQAFGEKKIDQRADIWSLGIILYQCLTGTIPTYGNAFGEVFRLVVAGNFTPIDQLVPGIPKDVTALVKSMLERDPEARPWDLREVHTVIERHAAISAPRFGAAVAPVFDELSTESTILAEAPRGTPAASPGPSAGGTLALTPSSLNLGGAGGRKPATTPGGGGTVAMSPSAHAAHAAQSGARPATPTSSPGRTASPIVPTSPNPSSTPTSTPPAPPTRGMGLGAIFAIVALAILAASAAYLLALRP